MTQRPSATKLTRARFKGKRSFDHFVDPHNPRCFACNSDLLKVRPIKVTDEYLLVPATTVVDGVFMVIRGVWQVYPRQHITRFADMPDNWTASLKDATQHLGIETNFNPSDNWGSLAGNTAAHGHTWLIPRGGEDGLLSENLGLATILRRIQEDFIPKS